MDNAARIGVAWRLDPGGTADIGEVQRRAWDNKIGEGFNAGDVALERGLLTAEVGEAFTAWRKQLPDLGEELADIAIFAASLAAVNGIDLDAEVSRKPAKNEGRAYRRDGRGIMMRVDGADA